MSISSVKKVINMKIATGMGMEMAMVMAMVMAMCLFSQWVWMDQPP